MALIRRSGDPMILVTGAAGFIGHAVCERLLSDGELVVGVDNLNDYYSPALKQQRLSRVSIHRHFKFIHADVSNASEMTQVFRDACPNIVVHLAAQAGVRYSLENPQVYVDSNITGFLNILNECVNNRVSHVVYASSSSVYGTNTKQPFDVSDRTDTPASMYAVTKKANELMAHAYHHLHGLRSTGLRFFTVYGPWGRPDMAFWKFSDSIIQGKAIELYNGGEHQRAFTYIDDVVDAVLLAMRQPNGASVHNVGGDQPAWLSEVISLFEEALGRKAIINPLPMQRGDVISTVAAPSTITGWSPKITLKEGVRRFAQWFQWYRSHE